MDILDMPNDLLRLFVGYLESHYDKRNYMIVCKKIYNAIPIKQKREHLFDLRAAISQTEKTTKKSGKGNRQCNACKVYYKRTHKCPGVLKKCFKCWGMYPLRGHYSCSGLKHCFEKIYIKNNWWDDEIYKGLGFTSNHFNYYRPKDVLRGVSN